MEKVPVTIELNENIAEAYFRLSDTQKRRIAERITIAVMKAVEENNSKFELSVSQDELMKKV